VCARARAVCKRVARLLTAESKRQGRALILGKVTPDLLYHVLFRFIHISSVIALLGGIVYARQVLVPILNPLPEDVRIEAARRAQKKYQSTLYTLLILIVGSGFYNLLSGPKHTYAYQIWFGIKMLLVAHIISAAILWVASPYGDITVAGKSKHRLVSIAISGLIVVFISAYLRSLTQRGL
jgi:uncharacterized membrane protein